MNKECKLKAEPRTMDTQKKTITQRIHLPILSLSLLRRQLNLDSGRPGLRDWGRKGMNKRTHIFSPLSTFPPQSLPVDRSELSCLRRRPTRSMTQCIYTLNCFHNPLSRVNGNVTDPAHKFQPIRELMLYN